MLNVGVFGRRVAAHQVRRRSFLQAGTLGLGGLTLPWLLKQQAEAAGADSDYIREKSVVLVFLSGGASHIETFNPNMGAPLPYRSITGEAATRIPGFSFGGTFPQLAQHADVSTLVRCYTHTVGGHVQAIRHVLSGGTDPQGEVKTGYGMGCVYSRIRGANHEQTGLPTNTLLTGPEVDGQYRSEKGRVQRGSSPGTLGAAAAPFQPGGAGPAVDNMQLTLTPARFTNRRKLLRDIDGIRGTLDHAREFGGLDRFTDQAAEILINGASKAFDLSQESLQTLERYDTSAFQIGKKKFRAADIGTQFLMARRLIEAGCGFVTLHSAGWDMHADGNNPGILSGMEMLGRPLDRGLSAFLEDLKSRGMINDVLVVVTGDFGRTPRINSRGGRDHWTRLCTLALFGGGIGRGEIVGRSDRSNGSPAGGAVSTGNLLATVMHTLFDIGKLRLDSRVPSELLNILQRDNPIITV